MQIIDIGICVNNTDPKAIGRIRYRPYSLFVSEIENGIKYDEWDESDPFVAIPFLPLHINVIPQVQQSIKLLRYDTDKETQNVEYVAGPFTSPHDLQNQTFAAQHKDTTYGGVIIKNIKDIRNKNGKFNSPTTPGAIINERDSGFRGNYGSDVIFTENGIQLRGGMLLSKEGKNKNNILDYPQLSKKMGRFSLKKFSKTVKAVKETIDASKIAVSKLKYIIEYELDSLTTPTLLKLYVYKIVGGYGREFNTDVFGQNSVFTTTDTSIVKLINTGNTLNDPTYIKSLDGTINSGYIELRELLHLIDMNNITVLDGTYPNEDVHPFYFRPTPSFRLTKGTGIEITNKSLFLSKIQVRNKVGGSNLIFSRQSADPPIIPNIKTIDNSKEIKNAGEQSFSNLSADKVYITSTTPNNGINVKTINFNELNEYELTQEDYINKIEPNTYAMVRGENLYNLLIAIKNLLDSHIHNINEPLVKTDPNWIKMNTLIETLRNDLLNDSVRIN
jgi:hypothetical protein